MKQQYHVIKYSQLPIDRLVTTGDVKCPKDGDIISWHHYDFVINKWLVKESAFFNTPEFIQMTDKYNELRNRTLELLLAN